MIINNYKFTVVTHVYVYIYMYIYILLPEVKMRII